MSGGTLPKPDLRVDTSTGARTYVVGSQQDRPNLPGVSCPFCPGGLEAPDEYEVRWFPNRWPSMPDGRCEVVLYTPEHDATFWSIGARGARKVVDLWAVRSEELGMRADIEYVLVFENRGPEVGATIAHPHGQIYAFDFVPDVPLQLLRGTAFGDPGDRLVTAAHGWRAWVPEAAIFPYALVLVPDDAVPDLPSLPDAGRDGLAALLVDVLERLDRLFDAQTPYMLWIHQRPFDGRTRRGRSVPGRRQSRRRRTRATAVPARRGRRRGGSGRARTSSTDTRRATGPRSAGARRRSRPQYVLGAQRFPEPVRQVELEKAPSCSTSAADLHPTRTAAIAGCESANWTAAAGGGTPHRAQTPSRRRAREDVGGSSGTHFCRTT